MKHNKSGVWISGLLVAALAAGVLAPAAEAKSKGSKRYKASKHSSRYYGSHYDHGGAPGRVVEIHRSSSAAPAIAGFIGGLVVGTVLSRASERDDTYDRPAFRDDPEYDYFDPYCDAHFSSLASYRRHAYGHRHPTIVRVIEIDTGRCAHVYRYHRGDWVEDEEDWDRY